MLQSIRLVIVTAERTIAVAEGVGIVGRAEIVGVGDAVEEASRRRRHALAVAVEITAAQAWIFIALDAERMTEADRLRWCAVEHPKSADSEQRESDLAHGVLLNDSQAECGRHHSDSIESP